MALPLNVIDICIVGGYLVLALWIGMMQIRKINSMRDYAVADRQFTVPLLVATISATIIGGESTLGAVETIIGSGLAFLIIFGVIGDPVSKFLMAQFISPRMTQFQHCISVGDVMERYYGKTGRIITGVAGTLLMVGLMGAQVSAMGSLFHYFLGVSHFWGALIGCGVVILYSTFGGIRAVTLTDMMQFGVLIIAIPVACNIGLGAVGGYGPLLAAVPTDRFFDASDSWVRYLFLLLIGITPFLNPAVMQRLLMARSSQELSKALRISAIIDVPFYAIVGFIGLTVVALAPNVEPSVSFPYFIDHFMPPGVRGLVIAGLLAVIMSTVDSYVNSASVTLVHDVLKPLFPQHMNDRRELILAKVGTFFLGSFALVIATRYKIIMDIVLLSLNFWGPIVVVPLYAVIFSVRSSKKSFVAGAAAGAVTVGVWLFFGLENRLGFDGLIPGMVLNGLFFLGMRTKSEKKSKIPKLSSRDKNVSWIQTVRKTHGGVWEWLVSAASCEVMDRKKCIVFGVFSIASYVVPYFMWTSFDPFSAALPLKLVGGVLSFLLIIKDYWPNHLKKYLYPYTTFTIFYCVPFLTSYMLLENNGSVMWIVNACLGILLTSILLNWVVFLGMLVLGVGVGIMLYGVLNGPTLPLIGGDGAFHIIYMYFFAVIIGVIFSRSREAFQAEKIDTMKAIAGSIAHEMRTPLATIRMGAESLRKKIPLYIDAHTLAHGAGISVPKIDHGAAIQTIHRFKTVTDQATFIIDMLLMKLKKIPVDKNLVPLSIKQCVENAIETYPLLSDQRAMIQVDLGADFIFYGHRESFTYVIYNLLKNALYHLSRAGRPGVITFQTRTTKDAHVLLISDTGPGIPEDQLPHIFDQFYTKTQHGTGLGLSFCRATLARFGAAITCQSVLGQYTTFQITFPRREETQ